MDIKNIPSEKCCNEIIITKDMVREGYLKGIIAVVDDAEQYGCDGICCMIGDNAFYFGSCQTENYDKASDYIKDMGVDRIIFEIFTTLNECIRTEFEDEYEYYYLVLKENGIGV